MKNKTMLKPGDGAVLAVIIGGFLTPIITIVAVVAFIWMLL